LPRWARYTLGSLGLVVLVVLAAGGYELWYLHGIYDRVTRLTGVDVRASRRLDQTIPTSSQPITALLIGSDHRADGATGQKGLSDTLMLARLDPGHHMASLLSIPRDLWTTIPGHGEAKINSAYSEGGDALSLATVEAATGVRPNYLVNVDFTGFRRLVDTLGGVYVNVDQHYYNPPAQEAYSGFSAIDLAPGYQRLDGTQALAFSRYRHTDDDFHRQARQQTFLRAFEARATERVHGISLSDIPFLNDLLDALSHSVTIVGPGGHAPSPRTLLTFAAPAYQARSHVVSVHLDWVPYTAPDGEAALQLTNLHQALAQWRHPWAGSSTARLPRARPRRPGTHRHHAQPHLPATITPTGEYRADFVHAQQVLRFPIMYPTVAQAASTFCPWVPAPAGPGVSTCYGTSTSPTRIYGIPAAGRGWNSTYAVFHMAAASGDAYWGIEETRYTDAPLLRNPNATRRLDGRTYLFFENGSHIQTIAFVRGGIAYWVENSLLDDLTNPEMIAIARSLRPVR